ncbi:MAG: hypothetical protein ACXW3D_01530 [Caulobacteraceae bacterium]
MAAPKAKIIPPSKVATLMKQAKFQVSGIYRKGPSYVVRAKGLTGNDVIVVVDGKSGKIIGLDVVKWAPGAKRVKRGSRGAKFTGDVYEFGVSISLPVLLTWEVYSPATWTSTSSAWIEVDSVSVSWSSVTYEESVTEVSYETYSEEYSEEYSVSLEEEVSSYESYEETIEESSESVETSETSEESVTTEESSEESSESVESSEEHHEDADSSDDGGNDDPGDADDGGGDDGGDDSGGDSGGDDGGGDDPGR